MNKLLAELDYAMISLKRYKFNTIFTIFFTYIVFVAIYGGGSLAGGGLGGYFKQNSVAFAIGYIFVIVVMSGVGGFAGDITGYAKTGILEQLFMSDIPFGITLVIRNIATIIVQFFFIASVLLLITLTMGIPFGFNPLHLVILLLSLFEVYGLGLIMGGIALLFKNVSSVIGALQFFFMPLAFASIQEPWLWLFPITPGAELMRRVSAGTLQTTDLLFFVLNTILYFAIGSIIFNICLNATRKRGTMGIY